MSKENVNTQEEQQEKGEQLDANLVIQQLQQQLADANYQIAILNATIQQSQQN